MKLFKVERTDNWSYDDYDSFLCAANSAEEARMLWPDPEYHMWKDGVACYSYGEQNPASSHGWVKSPDYLEVTEIDLSILNKPETLLASFNAG